MKSVILSKSRICFVAIFLALFSAVSVFAGETQGSAIVDVKNITQTQFDDYLKNISAHPRLFFPKGYEDIIKKNIATNASAKRIHKNILKRANTYLNKTPCERVMTGRRLLPISREVLKRVLIMSYAYRMTGDVKYAKRVEDEMLAVSKFSDWNPSHFLDVGEMTFAFAVGYDWLFDYLSQESKDIIAKAIYEKGLLEGDKKQNSRHPLQGHSNWNAVCNTGLMCGALATYENYPKYASKVIRRSVIFNQSHLEEYAPDGNYFEGARYWGYGTSYQIRLITALQSSIGTDFGLIKSKGFLESAKYIKHLKGPSGYIFNYHDCGKLETSFTFIHAWLAKNSDNKGCFNKMPKFSNSTDVFGMLLCSDIDMYNPETPTTKVFFGNGQTPVVLARTSWNDDALFMGMKGGIIRGGHAHMDAGTFVFDVGKTRFASEMTCIPYNILESQGIDLHSKKQKSQRWKLLRLGVKSHSVLIANSLDFDVNSKVPIIEKFDTKTACGATFDTTSLYFGLFQKSTRKAILKDENHLEITDTLETTNKPAFLRWNLITEAQPKIVGDTIELKRDGKKVVVKINSPYLATPQIFSLEPTEKGDKPVKDFYAVGFTLEVPADTKAVLKTTLTPQLEK
ncbi:MAG: heparinase II/III family protein [Opitutales bacterium]|nr:heparinase II/III family protein [Opitutales bacterium]